MNILSNQMFKYVKSCIPRQQSVARCGAGQTPGFQGQPPESASYPRATGNAKRSVTRGRVARQVSYEYGGLVVNAAILVDKEYPIVCKARRASDAHPIAIVDQA